jgi:hypothetical protein
LTYADRNDTHTSYLAGSKLQQTKRLNNIITYANDNSIRTYDLEYILKGLSTFGFSCPMIAREFNSTKGLNLSAVF